MHNFSKKSLKHILLVSILLIGVLLRFHGISNQSLWLDELASWETSAKPDIQSVIQRTQNDVHPPGFHLLLYYIEKYLGDSEWHLRLPSAVGGVVAIYLMYLIGTLLYSYREGLLAAALLASSWTPIYYSQEARVYSLLLCFGLGSVYFGLLLLQQLRSSNTLPWYPLGGYIVTATILCYLHYFGVLLVGLEAVWLSVFFLKNRRTFQYTCIVFLCIFILYSPWIPSLLMHFNRVNEGTSTLPAPTLKTVEQYLLYIFNWVDWYLYCLIAPLLVIYLVKKIVCFSIAPIFFFFQIPKFTCIFGEMPWLLVN